MTKLETLRAGFDKIHSDALHILKQLEGELQNEPDDFDFDFDADEVATWIWERL